MNLFVDHPLGEWLLDIPTTIKIILDAIEKLNITNELNDKTTIRILLPGIGKSLLGQALYKEGFTNLTLWDIDDDSILFQKKLFKDCLSVRINHCDILSTVFSNDKYDIIIDKSFLDVFLRQGKCLKAFTNISNFLIEEGYYFSISMFHKKWKRYLKQSKWNSFYGYMIIPRYSRTRPSIVSYTSNIAIIISKKKSIIIEEDIHEPKKQKKRKKDLISKDKKIELDSSFFIESINEISLKPLHNLNVDDFPVDASFY